MLITLCFLECINGKSYLFPCNYCYYSITLNPLKQKFTIFCFNLKCSLHHLNESVRSPSYLIFSSPSFISSVFLFYLISVTLLPPLYFYFYFYHYQTHLPLLCLFLIYFFSPTLYYFSERFVPSFLLYLVCVSPS